MTSVPGFLAKTFEIFSNPKYADWCGWGQNGDTIVIRKIEPFSKNVLPNYFKHSNFQSFVRQLNMYDFHKTVQDPSHGEFQHTHFRKDRPDLLVHIKRKAHNKNHGETGSVATMESSLSDAGQLPGASSSTKKSKLDKKRLSMLGSIEGLPPPPPSSLPASSTTTANSSGGLSIGGVTGTGQASLTTVTPTAGGRTGVEVPQPQQQQEMIEDTDLADLFGPHGSLGSSSNNNNMNGNGGGQSNVAPLPLSMPVSLPPVPVSSSGGYLPPPSFEQQQQQQQQHVRKPKSKSSKASTMTSTAQHVPSNATLSLYPEPGHPFDGGSVLEELVHQQTLHEHFERRLGELERQSLRVSGENALLKRVLVEYGSRQTETQQRVDKLIQLIYNVLVTNNALPPALTQSANMLLQDAQNLYQYTSQPVPQQQQLALKEAMKDTNMVDPSSGGTSTVPLSAPLSLMIPSELSQQHRYTGDELEHQNSFTLFDTAAFSPVDYNHINNSSGGFGIGLTPRMSGTSGSMLQLLPSSSTTYGGGAVINNNNNAFDRVATSIGHDWNKADAHTAAAHSAAPSLASLAYASAAVAHTDAEEREAAATLQRMTTPDYETMAALSTAAATSSNTAQLGSSFSSSSLLLPPLPPSLSSYSGGGELRRMASITGSYLDDHSLALSRGDSMETWTMYPPALSSASGAVLSIPPPSQHQQLQRQPLKRERGDQQQQASSSSSSSFDSGRPPICGSSGNINSNKLRKKDSTSSSVSSSGTATGGDNKQQLVQRLHSQQQAAATRIDSLEMTLGALLQQVAEEVYIHPSQPQLPLQATAIAIPIVHDRSDGGSVNTAHVIIDDTTTATNDAGGTDDSSGQSVLEVKHLQQDESSNEQKNE